MKKHKTIKHAHRKALIAEKKAKGKYSRVHVPNPVACCSMDDCPFDPLRYRNGKPPSCWYARKYPNRKSCPKENWVPNKWLKK